MKKYILILSILGIFSCKKSNQVSYGKKLETTQINSGKKLMESKCYVCHNPSTSQKDRIAPPMIAIKKHYISKNTTKEEFTNAMQSWIKNPTKENAKMFGAVKRFGVMPKQHFSEETIKQISEYMFDNEIEKPEWFESHYNKERGKGIQKGKGIGKNTQKQEINSDFKNLPYSERGLKYALSTKQVLGKNLMGKIQKEGTIAALEFCNIAAMPLTDSMSVYHNAKIKRVSDKPRNSNNIANKEESRYITIFKNDVLNDKESEPIVVETSEIVNVYYPIKTNGMCLQCHGTPKTQIKENTFSKIRELYPNDKAFGYDINEIRGIWNVSYSK
ncbi:Tll0287-like domain-containing protein [Polaribacter aestuariivivens]|uniref:Tll0287-like domain-containing protein n=1 Tax=Polaribacter aestuariivivens TaxID=2304626 RepID=UPI003F496548